MFHEYISQSFNLTRNNTWISFGGSYAGALSAWLKREVRHFKRTSGLFWNGFHLVDKVLFQKIINDLCHVATCVLLQFPHLVFAAVASSAPVRAKLDFSAYCKVKWDSDALTHAFSLRVT